MPGLCLLDVGDSPYIGYKIMPVKAYFNIFDLFSETTNMWHLILCQNIAIIAC